MLLVNLDKGAEKMKSAQNKLQANQLYDYKHYANLIFPIFIKSCKSADLM